LLTFFYVSWLSMKEIALLDKSICEKEKRSEFLSILKLDGTIFAGSKKESYGLTFIDWIVNRKIKLKYLKLKHRDLLSLRYVNRRDNNRDYYD